MIAREVAKETRNEVIASMTKEIVEPLVRLNKDQHSMIETQGAYIDSCLQANNMERYSNQGELTTLLRRSTNQLTDRMEKLSAKMETVAARPPVTLVSTQNKHNRVVFI